MFAGLTSQDFDAYQERKWRSNAYNRERLEVKQKLLDFGQHVAGLSELDGSPLLCEASTEHPALWNQKCVEAQELFFSRNAEGRAKLEKLMVAKKPLAALIEDPSPRRAHVVLTLRLALDSVFVGLKLHADAEVDRKNLLAKLAQDWLLEEFADVIRALPEATHADVGGTAIDCQAPDTDAIARAATELATSNSKTLVFGQSIDRNMAIELGSKLSEQLSTLLQTMLPLYQYIAWHRDNDYISISDQLREQTVRRKQRGLRSGDKVTIVEGIFAGRAGQIQEIDSKGQLKVLVGKMPIKVKASDVERA